MNAFVKHNLETLELPLLLSQIDSLVAAGTTLSEKISSCTPVQALEAAVKVNQELIIKTTVIFN